MPRLCCHATNPVCLTEYRARGKTRMESTRGPAQTDSVCTTRNLFESWTGALGSRERTGPKPIVFEGFYLISTTLDKGRASCTGSSALEGARPFFPGPCTLVRGHDPATHRVATRSSSSTGTRHYCGSYRGGQPAIPWLPPAKADSAPCAVPRCAAGLPWE